MYKQSKLIVKALDEDVCVYVKDVGTNKQLACASYSVGEAEKLIEELQKQIKIAKNSKWYVPKSES